MESRSRGREESRDPPFASGPERATKRTPTRRHRISGMAASLPPLPHSHAPVGGAAAPGPSASPGERDARTGHAAAASDADVALVERARAGDVAAFEQLFQATSGRIFALCLRMTGDRLRARELTHDAFVRAWERLDSFRGDSAFATWMHRLAVNVVLGEIRAERRRTARVALAMDEGTEEMESAPDGPLADPELRMDLDRAIARLPRNARRVFVLHDVAGYRHEEIAREMEIAEGTVRAHLHRARRLLMEWLTR